MPEINALANVEQPPLYHPEGDVLTHTLLLLEHMAYPSILLGWTALLHDIGKPETQSIDENSEEVTNQCPIANISGCFYY